MIDWRSWDRLSNLGSGRRQEFVYLGGANSQCWHLLSVMLTLENQQHDHHDRGDLWGLEWTERWSSIKVSIVETWITSGLVGKSIELHLPALDYPLVNHMGSKPAESYSRYRVRFVHFLFCFLYLCCFISPLSTLLYCFILIKQRACIICSIHFGNQIENLPYA